MVMIFIVTISSQVIFLVVVVISWDSRNSSDNLEMLAICRLDLFVYGVGRIVRIRVRALMRHLVSIFTDKTYKEHSSIYWGGKYRGSGRIEVE